MGAPQGSVFGPVVFIRQINDLPQQGWLMYADDSVAYKHAKAAKLTSVKLTSNMLLDSGLSQF